MTISSSNARTIHQTNGAVTTYTFNFKVFYAAHLRVVVVIDSTETDLIPSADYSVSGLGADYGGFVTLTPSGVTKAGDGNRLVILRAMPFVQAIDFQEHGRMPSDMVEMANDIAAMERQQLLEELGRAIRAPVDAAESITYAQIAQIRNDAQTAAVSASGSAASAAASNNMALSHSLTAQTSAATAIAQAARAKEAADNAEAAAGNQSGLIYTVLSWCPWQNAITACRFTRSAIEQAMKIHKLQKA